MINLDLLQNIEYILFENKPKYIKDMFCLQTNNIILLNNKEIISQEYDQESDKNAWINRKERS